MCQKSALQCQLTCLHTLYTVNPSPPSPQSNTHYVGTYCPLFSNTFLRVHKLKLPCSVTLLNITVPFLFVTVHLPVSRSNGERLYQVWTERQQRNGGGGGGVKSAIFVMISHKNRFEIQTKVV